MPLAAVIWQLILRSIPWILAYFTADTIVSHISASSSDRQKLLESISKQCKELNLSPDQCNALLSQSQTEQSSSPLADTLKWGIGGWLVIQLISNFKK